MSVAWGAQQAIEVTPWITMCFGQFAHGVRLLGSFDPAGKLPRLLTTISLTRESCSWFRIGERATGINSSATAVFTICPFAALAPLAARAPLTESVVCDILAAMKDMAKMIPIVMTMTTTRKQI